VCVGGGAFKYWQLNVSWCDKYLNIKYRDFCVEPLYSVLVNFG